MELRNEIFAHVYDWLRAKHKVRGQNDLSDKTGINKNTITNILKGNTNVSDRTLLKLNEGFGFIFNMQYLRGSDPYHMLINNLIDDDTDSMAPYVSYQQKKSEEKKKEESKLDISDTKVLMLGLENLLQVVSQQIKKNEELRCELNDSIQQVRIIAQNLQNIHIPKAYNEEVPGLLKAAEKEEKYVKK